MIDTRPRLLIVEDITTLRESYVANFQLEGGYRIDEAADLVEALALMDRWTYHVALVDIMLAGEKDAANRDGVDVLKHLHNLDEGTQAIVVSAQDDTQLVREFLKGYVAFDYLSKDKVRQAGISVLFDTVRAALGATPVGEEPSWEAVVEAVTDQDEELFVPDVMRRLNFTGGFENLSKTLIATAQPLLPLLTPTEGPRGLRFDEARGGLAGTFWSKGQGCAIRLLLSGDDAGDGGEAGGEGTLVRRERGGLLALVESDDTPRDQFLPPFSPRR